MILPQYDFDGREREMPEVIRAMTVDELQDYVAWCANNNKFLTYKSLIDWQQYVKNRVWIANLSKTIFNPNTIDISTDLYNFFTLVADVMDGVEAKNQGYCEKIVKQMKEWIQDNA